MVFDIAILALVATPLMVMANQFHERDRIKAQLDRNKHAQDIAEKYAIGNSCIEPFVFYLRPFMITEKMTINTLDIDDHQIDEHFDLEILLERACRRTYPLITWFGE